MLFRSKFLQLTPKTELSVDTFTQMLREVNTDVLDGGAVLALVFPVFYDDLTETLINTNPELVAELENDTLSLHKLVAETNAVFANGFTLQVYAALVDTAVDTLGATILQTLDADAAPGRVHKLATFLAQLSVQLHVLADPNSYGADSEITGNVYVNRLNDLGDLDEFSASIYSNFE